MTGGKGVPVPCFHFRGLIQSIQPRSPRVSRGRRHRGCEHPKPKASGTSSGRSDPPAYDTAARAGVMILSSWNWGSVPVSWPNTRLLTLMTIIRATTWPGAATTLTVLLMFQENLCDGI